MRVLRLSVGAKQEIQVGEKLEFTGLFKHDHPDEIKVGKLGFEGDFIGSEKHHGGPDQAVYIYTQPDYFAFQEQYHISLQCGMFGENMNISILESKDMNIGDILTFEEVTLQITGARFPCATLAAGMNDPYFVKKFREVGRPGLYCRVIKEGTLRKGDEVKVTPYEGTLVSVEEIFEDHYEKNADKATLERYLSTPLAERIRVSLENRLENL